MAKLINGNGNQAVYADQDADWYASIMGNQTSITGVGQQFEASILDAQTIGVADGVIITQEGRRIQLDADQVDTFEIPVGEQGTTNYYIIGYHLYTTDDSSQVCDTFVQLMESSSATIQEDTFRDGADEVYVSLYRVTQDGLTITDIDSLLPTIKDLTEIAADISQINTNLANYDTVSIRGNHAVSTTSNNITITPSASDKIYTFVATQGNYVRDVVTVQKKLWTDASIFTNMQLNWSAHYINIVRVDATHFTAISDLTDAHIYVYGC